METNGFEPHCGRTASLEPPHIATHSQSHGTSGRIYVLVTFSVVPFSQSYRPLVRTKAGRPFLPQSRQWCEYPIDKNRGRQNVRSNLPIHFRTEKGDEMAQRLIVRVTVSPSCLP